MGNHRAGVWDFQNENNITATNLFQKRSITFKLDDLREYGSILSRLLKGAPFRHSHRLFDSMRMYMVLEAHGQNTLIQWRQPESFQSIGLQFDLRHDWNSVSTVSFAWTWEVAPTLQSGGFSDASLFVSKKGQSFILLCSQVRFAKCNKGAERLMRRDRLRAYSRGGIQDISNFQSPYPFKAVASYLSNSNQDSSVTIEGGVVFSLYSYAAIS